jgi:hypothetical protein
MDENGRIVEGPTITFADLIPQVHQATSSTSSIHIAPIPTDINPTAIAAPTINPIDTTTASTVPAIITAIADIPIDNNTATATATDINTTALRNDNNNSDNNSQLPHPKRK